MVSSIYQLVILIIAIMLFLGIGFILCLLRINKDNKRKAEELYKISVESYSNKLYGYALFNIGKSISKKEHHQGYSLLGHVYEKLGFQVLEAEAFFRARRMIYDSSLLTLKKYDQEISYYFYRESLAYTKTNNWEFAYLRSDTAIKMIQSEKIPSFVDEKNIEVELRTIRMISALFYFEGKEAFDKSQIDAVWLKNNSKDHSLEELCESIMETSNLINNDFPKLLVERSFGKIFSN